MSQGKVQRYKQGWRGDCGVALFIGLRLNAAAPFLGQPLEVYKSDICHRIHDLLYVFCTDAVGSERLLTR